jgi:hypothetical protein
MNIECGSKAASFDYGNTITDDYGRGTAVVQERKWRMSAPDVGSTRQTGPGVNAS